MLYMLLSYAFEHWKIINTSSEELRVFLTPIIWGGSRGWLEGISTHGPDAIQTLSVIICPIAIEHSMGQFYKTGLRLPVCVFVCGHSHDRISWLIFTKIGTDVRTPKVKTSSLGSTSHHSFPILLPKTPILGQKVLKIHANMK